MDNVALALLSIMNHMILVTILLMVASILIMPRSDVRTAIFGTVLGINVMQLAIFAALPSLAKHGIAMSAFNGAVALVTIVVIIQQRRSPT